MIFSWENTEMETFQYEVFKTHGSAPGPAGVAALCPIIALLSLGEMSLWSQVLHMIAYTRAKLFFFLIHFLVFLMTFQNLDGDAACSCQNERVLLETICIVINYTLSKNESAMFENNPNELD